MINEEKFRRHVLHEFGHALGFIHEHLRSDFPYQLDEKEAKIEYPKWTWTEIQSNVLDIIHSKDVRRLGPVDYNSIMIYPFRKGLLINAPPIPWNTTLSESDKKYAKETYG
jgi:serralysin